MLTNFRNLASHEGAQSYTRMHFNLSAQNGKFCYAHFRIFDDTTINYLFH